MTGLTVKQIKWASQHDWFLSSIDGAVIVEDRSVQNGRLHVETTVFDNFKELRDWAGY